MSTATAKPRLRWYQYSLRSLFVLTVLVAIGGSWFAWKKQQKERERAAVKAIKEMGGSVVYDYQFTSTAKVPPGPTWLRAWLGDDFFAHVVFVGLYNTRVTDAEVADLKALPQLHTLDLQGTNVTDAGMQIITKMPHLEGLGFRSTKVTDAGLKYLREMTQLQELHVEDTKVTDEGVKNLQRALPNCQIIR